MKTYGSMSILVRLVR